MKKIIIFVITCLLYCNCSVPKEETNEFGYRRSIQYDGTIFDSKQSFTNSSVNIVRWYEVEKDGHRHEFVGISNGVTHWPDCKYCKENGKEKSIDY